MIPLAERWGRAGEFSGVRVAYLATERDLGVITEIFSGTPSADTRNTMVHSRRT